MIKIPKRYTCDNTEATVLSTTMVLVLTGIKLRLTKKKMQMKIVGIKL